MSEKLVFMVTHGPDDQELATVPFVMAVCRTGLDVQVVMGFQAEAVGSCVKGVAEAVEAPALPAACEAPGRLPGARRDAPRVCPVSQEPGHRRPG